MYISVHVIGIFKYCFSFYLSMNVVILFLLVNMAYTFLFILHYQPNNQIELLLYYKLLILKNQCKIRYFMFFLIRNLYKLSPFFLVHVEKLWYTSILPLVFLLLFIHMGRWEMNTIYT